MSRFLRTSCASVIVPSTTDDIRHTRAKSNAQSTAPHKTRAGDEHFILKWKARWRVVGAAAVRMFIPG
jgi:hypothetical protein